MNRLVLYFLAFFVSFLSMSYEYVLVQLSTLFIGDMISNYILVTSLFILFLGLGSLCFELIKNKDDVRVFVFVEIALSVIAFFSLIFVVWASLEFPAIVDISLYFFMSLIAFISGLELPWLINRGEFNLTVLALDYIGMIVSGLLLAFFVIPHFNFVYTAGVCILLNLLVAFGVSLHNKKIFAASFSFILFILFALNLTWLKEYVERGVLNAL